MKHIFPTLKNIRNLFRVGTHPHPVRDWFILTGIAALLLGGSAGWNGWVYMESLSRRTQDGATTHSSELDMSAVESVQKIFETRAEEAERYRSAYHFVDPSR